MSVASSIETKLREYGANQFDSTPNKIIAPGTAIRLAKSIERQPHATPDEFVTAVVKAFEYDNVDEARWDTYAGFLFFCFGREELLQEHPMIRAIRARREMAREVAAQHAPFIPPETPEAHPEEAPAMPPPVVQKKSLDSVYGEKGPYWREAD